MAFFTTGESMRIIEKENSGSFFCRTMRVLSWTYFAGAFFFLFFHSYIEKFLGLPQNPSPFWVALSFSMMLMLSYLSRQSSLRPEEPVFTRCHMLSKAASTTAFLGMFLCYDLIPAYLFGAAIDASILILLVISYRIFLGNSGENHRQGNIRVLHSLIETFCGGDPWVLDHVSVAELASKTLNFVETLPPEFRRTIKTSIWLVEYAIPPLAWKLSRMSRMPLKNRMEYLSSWANSRLAWKYGAYFSLRYVCLNQIYSESSLLQAIGYKK